MSRRGKRGILMHEQELAKRLKDREQAAFEYLIDYYKPKIEKFVFQYGIEPNRISEVVKEVFVNIGRKTDKFEQDTIHPIIHQIMIQTLKEDERRQKKVRKVAGNLNDSTQYGYYFERVEHISNQMNLREMSSKYKVPLILNYFFDKSKDEIATILKTNEVSMNKMLQQGEKLLSDKFNKIATSQQERTLHDSLMEMRYAFQRLPEFTDKQEVMVSIDQARKSQKWKKLVPTVGAVLGLFLFALLGLNYIQEQKAELKAAQEEEKAAKREAAEAIATTEPDEYIEELNPEIVEYMEQAIENFGAEIGLDDVNSFPVVQSVRSIIDELKRSPDMFGGVDDTKNYIDMMLTLPSDIVEKLESPSAAEPYSFMEVLGVSFMYEREFEGYLQKLVTSIPVDEYEQIVASQDNPVEYTGSEEIKNFLRLINEQGYVVSFDPGYSYLMVKLDMKEFKEKLAEKGYSEAYLSYVDYTVNQYSLDWTDWEVVADTLLEIESLINQYGDDYTEEFQEYLYHDMVNYLNQYLKIWDGQTTVYETEREEYYQFLENNPDSIYSNIIRSTLKDWEENEWKRTEEDYFSVEKLWFQLDEQFKNVKLDDIVELNRWPFTVNTGGLYRDYSSNLDTNLLNELNPLEVVSLYAYAYEKEDSNTYSMLYHSMNMEQNLEVDWFNMRNIGSYGLTDYTSENTATVYFAEWDRNVLASVELMKEDGIWKIMK